MTEGRGICFFASRGKCSESKLCDAKPHRIIETSLKRGDDEHKKISETRLHKSRSSRSELEFDLSNFV